MTGRPGSGLTSSLFAVTTFETGVMHAKPFCQFIFTPSEPQTPCAQDLLNVMVESSS